MNFESVNFNFWPNFAMTVKSEQKTSLKGIDNKRIVCLANLRLQKDHFNLLKAFKLVIREHPDWSLHLIGHDFDDNYSTIKLTELFV